MIHYILIGLYIIACFVLIMFVLLQPGKSDAAAVFGGGANSAAFGPRGTQTVLAKVTITAAIVFFLIAFLFSIPGLFEERSVGEGVGAEETLPVQPAPIQPVPEQTPGAPAAGQPAAVPATPADQGAKKDEPAKKEEAAKPGAAKKP
ncbi:MAG TPA: preprotein translocase subunit SecG [Blastocatellia bacterium]|nr:preprotein translocase subunit SecG [Blastocatellia bacterium]